MYLSQLAWFQNVEYVLNRHLAGLLGLDSLASNKQFATS